MRVVRSNDILSIKNIFGYNLKPILPNKPVYIGGDTTIPESSSKNRTPTEDQIHKLPETRATSPTIPVQRVRNINPNIDDQSIVSPILPK